MRAGGFEPPWCEPLDPKSSAYASSATPAAVVTTVATPATRCRADTLGPVQSPLHVPSFETLPPITSALDVQRMDSSGDGGPNFVYQQLLKSRIVFLGTAVDDDVANRIVAELLFLESADGEKDIWLYINSPGGSVTAGMAIYDTMQFVEPHVGTVCMGLAASMGQFLLCAGETGKRFSLPHARIMMHQPSGGVRGQASDIAIQAEQMRYTKQLMAERISFHTGQAVDQITADSDRDRWFTAEEAKEYGIVDAVRARRKG